ncbi:gluconokinase [Thioclava pacifica]|uniref:Gluconokinase n=1 Tax=Thioclava pacifica DSM 10166 TaxID=1353537 RepID=A0A074JKE0_9RHOB|nr:gluconokinase [Thioclava pacifica]KEO56048.1 hypothetical protein TP2_00580 [Thioclava pacifica DSM 10166]
MVTRPRKTPAATLVMGVCGTGKSTIARALAERRGGVFLDADDYHPLANRDHMAAGKPLSDEMRWDWLDAVANAVAEASETGPVNFACSALKHVYRDRLRAHLGPMKIVCLTGSRALIAARMGARQDHFMPVDLLESQLEILELPGPDEAALICDVAQAPEQILGTICRAQEGADCSGTGA